MGVDLTLMPTLNEIPREGWPWIAHDRWVLSRSRALWGAIEALEPRVVPQGKALIFGGDGYGDYDCDPYGQPPTYLTAGELCRVAGHPGVVDDQRNRAVWAALQVLDPEHPVILWWH